MTNPLREPFRSMLRTSRQGDGRRFAILGGVLGVLATLFAGYLLFYVVSRAAAYGEPVSFRMEELIPLLLALAVVAAGAAMAFVGIKTLRTVDDPWWFGDPGRKIVGARRLSRGGRRGIGVRFENDGVERLFEYDWPPGDEAREIAALEAVWALPQYAGPR